MVTFYQHNSSPYNVWPL